MTSSTLRYPIPDDDKFLECAVALEADFIVSGDKALQETETYGRIKILSPKSFLEARRKDISP